MNLDWSEADLAFRGEVRAFLDAKLTPDMVSAGRLATSVYAEHDAAMAWQAALAERGWAAAQWPREHGGADWTVAQQYLFDRERVASGAPPLPPMGLAMVAFIIMKFGTPEQQAFFLPRIISGEIFFCQGYSEPGAGSDLASLQSSAAVEGDTFVVNGSKIWTSHAMEANWIFALVRTSREGRPQNGITFLLVDMATPGVEVRPFTMMSGEQVQSAVFFTDVRVPIANALGAIGEGWGVAKYLLEFERGGNPYAPDLRERVARIRTDAASVTGDDGRPLADDPAFARKLAAASIRVDVLEMLELRLLSGVTEGGSVGAMSSVMKLLGSELAQHLTELGLEAAGMQGLAYQPHATRPGGPVPGFEPPADDYVTGAPWQAVAPLRYMNERAGSIYAGSSEIQRNIIAKLVLGI